MMVSTAKRRFSVAIVALSMILCGVVLHIAGWLPAAAQGTSTALALKGPSGLPLPRFVSLKFNRVNVRKGPSTAHQVAWVFARKGLPVEIIAEFEHWRRVRDSEGEEGWVFHAVLTGRRTALVAPWKKGGRVELYSGTNSETKPVAVVEAGTLGSVATCTGSWCTFSVRKYKGWIKQNLLWGVYPGEQLK